MILSSSNHDGCAVMPVAHSPAELLKPVLLYPQDRVIHRSLFDWAVDLTIEIDAIAKTDYPCQHAARIADIFNHAALILFSIGDVKSAQDLCYTLIHLFITLSDDADFMLAKHVFVPWLNLCRIDRLGGNDQQAWQRLNVLGVIEQNDYHIDFPYDNPSTLLSRLASLDDATYLRIKFSCILECIKILLHRRDYAALMRFGEHGVVYDEKEFCGIFYESLAIALANMNEFKQAKDCLDYASLTNTPASASIFNLRTCELMAREDEVVYASVPIQNLTAASMVLLQACPVSVNDVHYALHAVYVLNLYGLRDEAAKLGFYCLKAAVSLRDEVLKAQSLVTLYNLLLGGDGQPLIEAMLVNHYHESQYIDARQLMQNCFTDLKHVESNTNISAMRSLYENLLYFASHFTG